MNIPYECCECGMRGVKLWRQYQAFLEHITLKCRPCSEIEQKDALSEEFCQRYGVGRLRATDYDSIGWRVPAIPDERGNFWGYTSAPQQCVDWWNALPEKNLWKKKR
jgi:hypothetical protein